MNKKRILFWSVFLVAATLVGVLYWKKSNPLVKNQMISSWYINHQLRLIKHPHPDVAARAWQELHHMFFVSWSGYYILKEHVHDTDPISFQLERTTENASDLGLEKRFRAARLSYCCGFKAAFYKAEENCCKTVGDAIKVIFYHEKKWKEDYDGDWGRWWLKNQKHYQP